MTVPVYTTVSQATCACGSCARMASRMASEIWSATLSGWPSDTDSDVNKCFSDIKNVPQSKFWLQGLMIIQTRNAEWSCFSTYQLSNLMFFKHVFAGHWQTLT